MSDDLNVANDNIVEAIKRLKKAADEVGGFTGLNYRICIGKLNDVSERIRMVEDDDD